MANDLTAKIKIDGDASGAVKAVGQAEKSLNGLGDAGKGAGVAAKNVDGIGEAAQRSAQKADPANRSIKDGIASIGTQLTEVKALYAAWLGAQAAGNAIAGIATTADAYKNLAARVKLVTGEGAAFKSAFDGIQEVALRTNSSLETTGTLFARLAEAGKSIGVGQAEALRLTETVNQAIQLSGASAQASQASITQLIQGLQSGVLRGDEFNSVMEQSPRLAKALADGLGVTTGELRKMSEAGQLSADTVIKSLQGQAAVIDREFGTLPATIGRAVTDLQTQWQRWIGTLDESTGASSAAAGAIEALAKNFDFVASSLINAGQAYLGWKAYNMAAEFLSVKTAVAASAAAKAADTAATIVNTAATAANTTAQVANTAARGSALGAMGTDVIMANTRAQAASSANLDVVNQRTVAVAKGYGVASAAAGAFASAMRLISGIGLAVLLTNIKDIGTWMGEAAAKAMGYGKAMADNELQMKATENATRAAKDMDNELAQKKQVAADKALGLSKASQKLVADFSELTKAGGTTAEALGKIGKDLDLSNIKGIAEAGATLDALAMRGKISADQVKQAWQDALKGQDLMAFEVQANAAFDGTEQGARRLAGAIDAQLGEALRRTGLDAGELGAGINKATALAINDFDILNGRVAELKGLGVDAGIALAASLDQAEKSVTTAAAAQAIIDRWTELGNAGLVTGTRLAEGLEKARLKLDELTPGITSVNEAFKTLGMKSPEELKKTAVAAEEAFKKIQAGSDFSRSGLANVNEAFRRMAEASIAANGGIASDIIRVQAEMRGLEIVTDSTGKTIIKAMLEGADATNGLTVSADEANGGYVRLADQVDVVRDRIQRLREEQQQQQQDAPPPGSPPPGNDGVRTVTTSPAGKVSSSTVDFTETLYRRGGTIEETKLAQKYVGELYARNQATMLTGNLGNSENASRLMKRAINDAVDKALEAARDEIRTGKSVDLGTSVSDLQARNLAQTPIKSLDDMISRIKNAGNEAKAQVHRIELVSGNQKTSLSGSETDVKNFMNILNEHKLRAS